MSMIAPGALPQFASGAANWRKRIDGPMLRKEVCASPSHIARRKEEIMLSVDRSFDDFFEGFGTVPIKIVNESRKWTGSRMDFSFDAKVGIVSTPIKGFVDVTDKDVTVGADLGWLERLIPPKQTQAAIEGRVKGVAELEPARSYRRRTLVPNDWHYRTQPRLRLVIGLGWCK